MMEKSATLPVNINEKKKKFESQINAIAIFHSLLFVYINYL